MIEIVRFNGAAGAAYQGAELFFEKFFIVFPGKLRGNPSAQALGDIQQRMVSKQDGFVLTLRMFSRVREGESVGVIVERNADHGREA